MRPAARPLAAALALSALLAGCAELAALEEAAALRPIAAEGIAARPARLAIVRTGSPLGPDPGTVGAVLVNLEGQRLRAESPNMRIEPPFRGTVGGFLAAAGEAYRYTLYEVRGPGGRTLGYLLVHRWRIAHAYLGRDGVLFLTARPVRAM